MAGTKSSTQNFLPIFVLLVGLALSLILTMWIIRNPAGGTAAAVFSIGILLTIACVINPKVGLYIVTIEAFTLDLVKKVAVYYGAASDQTIKLVLIAGILAVVGTVFGFVVQGVVFRRFQIAKIEWGLMFLGAIVFVVLVKTLKDEEGGFAKAAQDAFNAGFYIALVAVMNCFLCSREDLLKLLKLQFWLAVIWAIWGIRQYFFGFTDMEWFYARTGLSIVSSNFMLNFADPRPFGFASGAPNYGVISSYIPLGLWLIFNNSTKRIFYLLGSAILMTGTILSLQRTMLLLPFIMMVFYFFFKTPWRTAFMYFSSGAALLLGIIFSGDLLLHLDDINSAITTQGRWGESVMVVSTFSDRLKGWEVLKDPTIYSLFGTHNDNFTHDLFSRTLNNYGVIGLLLILFLMVASAWRSHRAVFQIQDPKDRSLAMMMCAITAPNILLAFAGGGNFTSVPINLQIWTFFGAIIALIQHSKRTISENVSAPVLDPVAGLPHEFSLSRR